MTDQEDRIRYERNFGTIFSKLNRTLPVSGFALTMTIVIAFWGSLFGLIYVDMQNFKQYSTDQYTRQKVEVVRELGEVKALIAQIKR